MWALLSAICNALRLFSLAENFWQRHLDRKAQFAESKVDLMSDADVTNELRTEWRRD
jgi:hypothetical protein